MYQIVEGNWRGLNDVTEFIGLINSPPAHLLDFFDRNTDIFIARAPGRLDVMGGIADYSGSLVLEMPIAEATVAAVQKTREPLIKIVSLSPDLGETLIIEMPVSHLEADGEPLSYASAKENFIHGDTKYYETLQSA